jgi:hypothetical protein
MRWIAILIWIMYISSCLCGHEVLLGLKEEKRVLESHEIAIIQYDNRNLQSYWNVTARWNYNYARKHGHQYLFLTKYDRMCLNQDSKLHPAWCKIKAMLTADELLPKVKAFVYMDNDVLISASNYSMSTILSYIKSDLSWDWEQKPVAFNQDGPGFACKQAIGLGYDKCFNSGTIVWIKGEKSREILQKWWDTSGEYLNTTKYKMNWKLKVRTIPCSLNCTCNLLGSLVAMGASSTIRNI